MHNCSVFIEWKILRIPIVRLLVICNSAFAISLTLGFGLQMLAGAARRSRENPLKGTFFYIHLWDIGSQVDALISVIVLFVELGVQ